MKTQLDFTFWMSVHTLSPGSVYNDLSLMSSLPGEFSCNKRVSVIKVRWCSCFAGNFFHYYFLRQIFAIIWLDRSRNDLNESIIALSTISINFDRILFHFVLQCFVPSLLELLTGIPLFHLFPYTDTIYHNLGYPIVLYQITCTVFPRILSSHFFSFYIFREHAQIHPHTHPFDLLKHGGFHSDGQLKCNKGGVTHFKRAVLLIRYVCTVNPALNSSFHVFPLFSYVFL